MIEVATLARTISCLTHITIISNPSASVKYTRGMYIRRGGELVKITKKSINAVPPSVLKKKRDAFERKKKTKAFRRWRVYQYKVTQKGLCFYCKRPIKGVWVTDHVIPLFRGGTSTYSNLVVCCWDCNKRKGIKIYS